MDIQQPQEQAVCIPLDLGEVDMVAVSSVVDFDQEELNNLVDTARRFELAAETHRHL